MDAQADTAVMAPPFVVTRMCHTAPLGKVGWSLTAHAVR